MHSRTHRLILATLIALYGAITSAVAAQESTASPTVADSAAKTDTYPLDTCPISGKKLGEMGRVVVRTYGGREVRLCCASCAAELDADPQAGLKKLDERIIAAQKPGYPLDTCLVSGKKLGEMGKPVDYVYDNQLVRFCCPSCIDKFTKQPEEYMAKLRATHAAKETCKCASDAASPKVRPQGHAGHATHAGH